MKNRLYLLLLLSTCLSAFSCQPTRRLQEGELLYRKASFRFTEKPASKAASGLPELARPKPNGRFLGIPVKLSLYNTFATSKKGLGKWLAGKLGEPPALYDEAAVRRSILVMEKYLNDQGYLQATVSYDTLVRRQQAQVIYQVNAGPLYTISEVQWPADSTPLQRLVQESRAQSFLKVGAPYHLQNLKKERDRLATTGLENGFYGLSSNNFYYYLDTAVGTNQLTLYLRTAEANTETPLQPHFIGTTTVFSDYQLGEDDAAAADTLRQGGLRFIQREEFVSPAVLQRSILQDEGGLFRESLQQKSVNRLLGLGTFKFVDLKYQARYARDSLFLDREFYLTPNLTQNFSAEIEASSLSTSGNSLGSALNFRYAHRNIFGGAEQFEARLSAGIETQIGKEVDFINNFHFELEGQLRFPHLLSLSGWLEAEKSWQARTVALVNAFFQRRTGFFSLATLRTRFGYQWQPSRLHQYQWYPFQATLVNLLDETDAFRESIKDNPRLQQTISDYLIVSTAFYYSYGEQNPQPQEDYWAVNASVEPAGNLLYALASLFHPANEQPYQLLGLPFAQFLKLEGELRYHHFMGASQWGLRANIGLAAPYGNSTSIPYVRQFFVGGANSIRAWQIRALGPGSSEAGISQEGVYRDQTGDIKLELTGEYRFPIAGYLKGAAFIDAGNIWLSPRNEEENQEMVFDWGRFYKEIAVGAGLGLRFDFTYFVFRLDLAFPLRKPYLPEGERWVLDEIRLGLPSWRRENLVWNLALGYPF